MFEKYSLIEEAIATYTEAMEVFPDSDFSYQLAKLYGEQGNLEKMFDSYLTLIKKNRSYLGVAQQNFSQYISENSTEEGNVLLRKSLLRKLQKQPDILYNELLSWLFVQQKDYKKAFLQEKAIYKRMGDDDMSGIADIAYIATKDEDYENATLIVNYLLENASTPEGKIAGHQYLMKIKRKTSKKKNYPEIEKETLPAPPELRDREPTNGCRTFTSPSSSKCISTRLTGLMLCDCFETNCLILRYRNAVPSDRTCNVEHVYSLSNTYRSTFLGLLCLLLFVVL